MSFQLRSLGERVLVRKVGEWLGCEVDDDCVAMALGAAATNDTVLVLTTDMLAERTHIPRGATAYQIGWHVIAINLSDLAAKGARPFAALTALGLPPEHDLRFLSALVRGMRACARRYRVPIVGGDTKETQELVLACTCIGTAPRTQYLARSRARVGNMVLLTGTLGRAAAAHYRRDAGGVLLVKPRIAEGMALARTNCVNACIDLSDGLSSALYQLARASNVGFLVNYDALPRSAALRKVPPELCERFVLHFGGDYELLFTAARENLPQIARALRGTKVTLIGEVIEGSEVLLTRKGGGRVVLPDEGYQHFREK